jgi:hypothetical protein
MAGTGLNNVTDLYRLYNVVQNTLIRFPKDLVIASLREFFKKDSYYNYVDDPWGFPLTPDHTDLHPEAGLNDDLSTRVYIGEAYRFDIIYYPAILVRSGSWRHVPISLNRDQHRVDYETVRYVDGYGNEILVQNPSAYILSGAWEGSIVVDIYAQGLRERDDLVELVSILFMNLCWNEAFKSGVSIKPNVSIGAPTEGEDKNDKLFKQSITIEMRTEWRQEIPVSNVLEIINFCVDFVGDIDAVSPSAAPNIQINTKVDLLTELEKLGQDD